MGVGQSTISRWIYQPIKPDTDKLALLADTLGLDLGELLVRAGHSGAVAASPEVPQRERHRLSVEIDLMLAGSSPIPAADRAALETLLDRAIDPYRRVMRRRRAG